MCVSVNMRIQLDFADGISKSVFVVLVSEPSVMIAAQTSPLA